MSWDKTLVTPKLSFGDDDHTDPGGAGGIDPAWFERRPATARVADRPLWVTREEEPEPLLDLAALLEPDPRPEPLPAPPFVAEPPILPPAPVELALDAFESYAPPEPYAPAPEPYAPAPEPYAPAPEPYVPAEPALVVEAPKDVEPPVDSGRRGRVVVFYGCRGGSGATTLTVNTASVLARAGHEVCVVDLDLLLGDVLVTLDLEAKISVTAMARDGVTMDGAALRRRLQRHDSGFYALAQTGRIDDMDTDVAERVPELLRILAQHFDVVLVDGLRDFSDHAVAALDAADQVALVFTQDVAGVRRAARVVELCRKLGYDDAKLRMVVNRHSSAARVKLPEIERALALPVAATVANDYRSTNAAQDVGAVLTDLRPRSRVARDVALLATGLLGHDAAPAARSAGLWSRLFGRKS